MGLPAEGEAGALPPLSGEGVGPGGWSGRRCNWERCAPDSHGVEERCASDLYREGERCVSDLYQGERCASDSYREGERYVSDLYQPGGEMRVRFVPGGGAGGDATERRQRDVSD